MNGEHLSDEEYRALQVRALEELQEVMDENAVLRAKYNSLLTQVVPLVDPFTTQPGSAAVPYAEEQTYTPEELGELKQRLEQVLAEYRNETLAASHLNSELEHLYGVLNSTKMAAQQEKEARLTGQNRQAAESIANVRAKSKQLVESWTAERNRLVGQIEFLKKVYESSTADIREFEEQSRTNAKGIQHLTSSIAVAKEDIREFTDQLQKIDPKMKEYTELRAKHQQSEERVVELSDRFEELKTKVETESLTANVRRQIDSGFHTIEDLNTTIDQIQCRSTAILEENRETKARIKELEQKLRRVRADTHELLHAEKTLRAQTAALRDVLVPARVTEALRGGENNLIEKELSSGVAVCGKDPWEIRHHLRDLKETISELDAIEAQQEELERAVAAPPAVGVVLPQRKRVPLIPLKR